MILLYPRAEPYYHLKFCRPGKFNQLKAQSMVIVGSIKQDDNSGLKLINQLFYLIASLNQPCKVSRNFRKDVYAKTAINDNKLVLNHLMSSLKTKRNQFKYFNDQFIERQVRFLFDDETYSKIH